MRVVEMSVGEGSGMSHSSWKSCHCTFDPSTRVLSWLKGPSSKLRLGHMRIESLFVLPERDGKREHRFDVLAVVVTTAAEKQCLKKLAALQARAASDKATADDRHAVQGGREEYELLMQYKSAAAEVVSFSSASDADSS